MFTFGVRIFFGGQQVPTLHQDSYLYTTPVREFMFTFGVAHIFWWATSAHPTSIFVLIYNARVGIYVHLWCSAYFLVGSKCPPYINIRTYIQHSCGNLLPTMLQSYRNAGLTAPDHLFSTFLNKKLLQQIQ